MNKAEFDQVYFLLTELGKFIKWNRKRISKDLQDKIYAIEGYIEKLESTIEGQKGYIEKLISENERQKRYIAKFTSEINKQKGNIKELNKKIDTKETKIAELISENERQKRYIAKLTSEINKQKGNVKELNKKIDTKETKIAELISENERQKRYIAKLTSEINKQKGNIKELNKELDTKETKIAKLVSENERQKESIAKLESSNSDIKIRLISNILSSKGTLNESFVKFKQLIEKDFYEFANSEKSLAEEAEAFLKLQSIIKKIEILLKFSGIYDKNIIAVGGGFSAGKSEFISSLFMDTQIKLPIGIKPVTAIPTYITSSKNNIIKGFTKNGGSITIDPTIYKELSHDFVKTFSFNLKDIMPAMSIETPLAYKNICFIDTPGYNPSDTSDGFTNEDIDTAKEYLENPNVLIWMIGLDSYGTIPDSDIKFLDNLSLDNKWLFIIANKADLKSNEDIEEILDNFEEILDYNDIEYSGISAYSSIDKEEIAFRKTSIFEFLDFQDFSIEVRAPILKGLNEVFDSYEVAINNDIEFMSNIRKQFKSLELDMLETGFDKYDEKVSNRINEMKKSFDVKEYKKQLQHLGELKAQILKEFNNIFTK